MFRISEFIIVNVIVLIRTEKIKKTQKNNEFLGNNPDLIRLQITSSNLHVCMQLEGVLQVIYKE